ncbi:hypothetical protein SAMN04488128_104233 [Chitinophaga eiseniae]|uniref:Uncharacterized protein n=1 Tax=Chitinophaga eiseniae TaxID=634771 RepID=A0A1T4TAI4_9BACT|nr:hypothetical protein [Chitinophaga eiseniae]SKA37188.1 hypothetical protein SAMN04488128_104233 [Chitinophaga eiseniae]
MASCLWYTLIPRYLLRSQLDTLTQANPRLKQAFAPPAPGNRNIICNTLPGSQLHTRDWQPLWTTTPADVSVLVAKAVRRILLEGSYNERKHQRCQQAAYDVLCDCMAIENEHPQLLSLSLKWRLLFNEATADAGQEHYDQLTTLGELVERIWVHLIIGDQGKNGDTDARLFVDVDRHFRRTYLLDPASGLMIRRAFLGVVSSSMELSGFNPYSCMVEGAGKICGM